MSSIAGGPRLLAVALLRRAAPWTAAPLMIAGALASATTVPASPLVLLGGLLAHLRPTRSTPAATAAAAHDPVILRREEQYSAAA